jgi:mono/diheme cytochrome c family protein
MRPVVRTLPITSTLAFALALGAAGCRDVAPAASAATSVEQASSSHGRGRDHDGNRGRGRGHDRDDEARDPVVRDATAMIREGREIFRFDTFGDEAFWTGVLRLHEPLSQVSPRTALAVGLKVDVEALPGDVVADLRNGRVDLDDPAVTLALIEADAVLGVKGVVEGGRLTSIGLTCAVCHSTVDDSLAPGIGRRLDGWANQDLNVGAIVSLSPNLQAIADVLSRGGTPVDVEAVRQVLASWGPGKYDAELNLDAKGLRPDGGSGATIIPPAFGLAGVNLHTWTGWGSVPYWNAYVAATQLRGIGTFFDPRLNDATKFPVAAATGLADVRPPPGQEDRITPKLGALHFYQLALGTPPPPEGSFDAARAAEGKALFAGKARCATCHVPPLFTEPGWAMHTAEELAIDDFQARRSPDERHRTTPLKGLWTHMKRGFYHDGRFATLLDVIDHYDGNGVGNGGTPLGLTADEKAALVEYLKSL